MLNLLQCVKNKKLKIVLAQYLGLLIFYIGR
jgi:hypothetical protein